LHVALAGSSLKLRKSTAFDIGGQVHSLAVSFVANRTCGFEFQTSGTRFLVVLLHFVRRQFDNKDMLGTTILRVRLASSDMSITVLFLIQERESEKAVW
jgi:hypothetical protein